jgi:hypothetical protein
MQNERTAEELEAEWSTDGPTGAVAAYARWRHRELGEEPGAAADQASLKMEMERFAKGRDDALDLARWR